MNDPIPLQAPTGPPEEAYWRTSNSLRDVLDLSDEAARAGDFRDAADTVLTALQDLAPALAVLAALIHK